VPISSTVSVVRSALRELRLGERVRRLGRRSALFDLLTAVFVFLIGMVDLWLLSGPLSDILARLGTPMTFSRPLAAIAMTGMTLPLALRRIFPSPRCSWSPTTSASWACRPARRDG
jgi:hypothetical protein